MVIKRKIKSAYFCQNCGYQSPKWLGKCPQCNEWNTFVEEIINNNDGVFNGFKSSKSISPILVSEINYDKEKRIITNDTELNRVLGGGIVTNPFLSFV